MDINSALNLMGIGNSGLHTDEEYNNLRKHDSTMTSLADIYDRVSGAQSTFYDRFDLTNDKSAGQLDTFFAKSKTTLNAGDKRIYVDTIKRPDNTEIEPGSEITIYDGNNFERKIIKDVEDIYTSIGLTTPLTYSYSKSANISRSQMKITNETMRFRGWENNAKKAIGDRTDTNVLNQASDLSGSGRKLTKLSNGWLVSCVLATANSQLFFMFSKDGGINWSLLYYTTTATAATAGKYAICSYGTMVFCLAYDATNKCYRCISFDATTVVGGSSINLASGYVVDTGRTTYGDGCSITVNEDGKVYVAICAKDTTYPNSFNILCGYCDDGIGAIWCDYNGFEGNCSNVTITNTSTINHTAPDIAFFGRYEPAIVSICNNNSTYIVESFILYNYNWITGTVYSGGSYIQKTPSIIYHEFLNTLYVTWAGRNADYTSNEQIYFNNITDIANNTWGTPVLLTSTGSFTQFAPSIGIYDKTKICILCHGSEVTGDNPVIRKIVIDSPSLLKTFPARIVRIDASTYIYPIMCANSQDALNPQYIYYNSYTSEVKFGGAYEPTSFNNTPYSLTYRSNKNNPTENNANNFIEDKYGFWYFAYVRSDTNLNVVQSKDKGKTWFNIGLNLSNISSNQYTPTIATYDNFLYLVWTGIDATHTNPQLKVAKYTISSNTWSEWTNILTTDYITKNPSVQMNGNKLCIAWAEISTSYPVSTNICYTESSDLVNWYKADGTTLGYDQITKQNSSGCNFNLPSLIIRNSKPVILSQFSDGTYNDIFCYYFSTSWLSNGNVYVSQYAQQNINTYYDSSTDKIYIVWMGKTSSYPNYFNVRGLMSSDGGVNWYKFNGSVLDYEQITVDASHDVQYAKIFKNNNKIGICYISRDSNFYYVYLKYYDLTKLSFEEQYCYYHTTSEQSYLTICPNVTNVDKMPMIWYDSRTLGFKYAGSIDDDDNIEASVVESNNYDISGTGRKITKLLNGWFIACTINNGSPRFYKSTDKMKTWEFIGTFGGGSVVNGGISICSYNSYVFVLVNQSNVALYSLCFDALSTSILAGWTLFYTATEIGSGLSIDVDSGGTLHVTWCAKTSDYPNSFNIFHAKSTDKGATWTKQDNTTGNDMLTLSNTAGTDYITPCVLCKSDKNPIIIFDKNISSNYGINSFYWTGTAWSSIINIYGDGTLAYDQANPSACIDKTGIIWVTWQGMASGLSKYNIKVKYSADGGITWVNGGAGSENLTSENTYDQINPTIGFDLDSNIFIIWAATSYASNTYTQLYMIYFDKTRWGSKQLISLNPYLYTTSGQMYPSICLNCQDFKGLPAFIYKHGSDGGYIRTMVNYDYLEYIPISNEDVRYKITPLNQKSGDIISWVKYDKEAGFDIDSKVSIVATAADESYANTITQSTDLTTYIEKQFLLITTPNSKITQRITAIRKDLPQINLLSGVGTDCDNLYYWDSSGTLSLDTTKKVIGSYSIKLTNIGTNNFMFKYFNTPGNKYYFISAYVQNNNATTARLQYEPTGTGSGGANNFQESSDTTKMVRLGIKIGPSNYGTYTKGKLLIYCLGSAGQSIYADGVMLCEITADEYNLSIDALFEKYPYVNAGAYLNNNKIITYLGALG